MRLWSYMFFIAGWTNRKYYLKIHQMESIYIYILFYFLNMLFMKTQMRPHKKKHLAPFCITILATQYLVWCPLKLKKERKEKSGQTVWVYFTTFSIKVSRKAFPPDGKVWLVHKTWLIGLTKSLASFKSGRLTFFPFSAAFATEKKIRKIIRKQYCISETRED